MKYFKIKNSYSYKILCFLIKKYWNLFRYTYLKYSNVVESNAKNRVQESNSILLFYESFVSVRIVTLFKN